MSSIFDGCCITFSGVFDAGNHSKLQSIVKEHGAVHSSSLTKKTTHLVVTKEDYARPSMKVTSARARAEEISIVTWQWVEDSISQKCKVDESKKRAVKTEKEDTTDENSVVVASSSKSETTKKKRKIKTSTSSASVQTVDVKIVEEKKMVTIIKKGKAPVDSLFREKDRTHVYSDDTTVWDCLLNQTNVANNNNKFFVIQLLKLDSANQYFVFTRWGRVGYEGQQSTLGPFFDLD
ncbi:16063_t:CDS:2, partial [Acaulospora morrowiae]